MEAGINISAATVPETLQGKIAVAGATGRLGAHVADLLDSEGRDFVAMSRSTGVDLVSGDGLDEALAGVETVIDVATTSSPDAQEATEYFTAATRNLQQAAERAGVRRIVVVSIVGIDHFTSGYQSAKVAHEQAMLAGPVPVHILRAAQFHEFVGELVGWGTQGDVSYVPKMRTQLVAARAVGKALIDMAADPDPALISEIAGPREESLFEAATLLATRRGDLPRIVEASNSDDPDRELLANGTLLPGPDATLAGPTFEEWVESSSG